MTTPELEAVARAIFDVLHPGSDWNHLLELAQDPVKIVAVMRRDECLKLARAALMAIREPSEGMLQIFAPTVVERKAEDKKSAVLMTKILQHAAAAPHIAMIDYILSEPKT